MARKLTFGLALLALTLLFTSAGFANIISNQVTFGPATSGTINVGTKGSPTSTVTGWAYLGDPAGTFTLSNISITLGSPNQYGPTTNIFTVTIGSDTLSGWLTFDEVIPIGPKYAFYFGTDTITSSTPWFTAQGFPAGATVEFDFTTYKGLLSSGELTPAVPEPGTIALVGSGLLAVAGVLRRKL